MSDATCNTTITAATSGKGGSRRSRSRDDEHLVTVIRYIERNALRAGLAERAEEWPWSSLANPDRGPRLDTETIARKADWLELVHTPTAEAEDQAIRLSITRDRPYGSDGWTVQTAARMGLTSSLRSRGRPITRASED